jgi:transcriptional regulator with XRE-family HTH domain
VAGPGRLRRADRPREAIGRGLTHVLVQVRLERGLARRQVAHAAGVSLETLAKIEQGRTTDPGFTTVLALAEALGISLDDLAERARLRGKHAAQQP